MCAADRKGSLGRGKWLKDKRKCLRRKQEVQEGKGEVRCLRLKVGVQATGSSQLYTGSARTKKVCEQDRKWGNKERKCVYQ